MQKNTKFFDDLARLASSAGGTVLEIKREVEALVAQNMEKMLRKMDLVTREDFNLVREIAIKARTQQEKLERRIDELETQLAKARVDAVTKEINKKPQTAAKKPAGKSKK